MMVSTARNQLVGKLHIQACSLVRPASPPQAGNILDRVVRLPGQPGGRGEIDLPPAVAEVPGLPVVDDESLAPEGIEEALSPAILAVPIELEGEAPEAGVVPVAVATPVVGEYHRYGEYGKGEGCEGELHGEDVFVVGVVIVQDVECELWMRVEECR
jgi:hypothetical protein